MRRSIEWILFQNWVTIEKIGWAVKYFFSKSGNIHHHRLFRRILPGSH